MAKNNREKLLPIRAAIREATGATPSPQTINRWILKGIQGVRLRSQMIGGRRYSTPLWVEEFNEARTVQTTPALMDEDYSSGLDAELFGGGDF